MLPYRHSFASTLVYVRCLSCRVEAVLDVVLCGGHTAVVLFSCLLGRRVSRMSLFQSTDLWSDCFFVVYHRSALCCYVPLTRVAVHVRFPFLVRPAFCDGFAQTASTTSLFSDMQRSFSCLDRVATATVVAVVSYADAGGSLQRRPLPTAPLAVVAPYPSMLSWRAGCASPARWAPGDFEPGWDAPGPRQTAACAGFSAGARSSVVF